VGRHAAWPYAAAFTSATGVRAQDFAANWPLAIAGGTLSTAALWHLPWRRRPSRASPRCVRRRGGHGGADALNSLWFRYTGPDTTLSFAIMLDILLMVVIGGMGTMYGAVIGAALFIVAENYVAENYLQKLMAAAAKATEALPLLPDLLHPDRWLLWLGVLFVLSVYFFPTGIVGKLRQP